MNHVFHLQADLFTQILLGHKTIEARLYDDKRRVISLGDRITLVKGSDALQSVEVKVVGLSRFMTFEAMFESLGTSSFGIDAISSNEAARIMRLWYSLAQQRDFGVLGIHLRFM
jgi:ASC-1-like (ASCH) protein